MENSTRRRRTGGTGHQDKITSGGDERRHSSATMSPARESTPTVRCPMSTFQECKHTLFPVMNRSPVPRDTRYTMRPPKAILEQLGIPPDSGGRAGRSDPMTGSGSTGCDGTTRGTPRRIARGTARRDRGRAAVGIRRRSRAKTICGWANSRRPGARASLVPAAAARLHFAAAEGCCVPACAVGVTALVDGDHPRLEAPPEHGRPPSRSRPQILAARANGLRFAASTAASDSRSATPRFDDHRAEGAPGHRVLGPCGESARSTVGG